MVKSLVIEKKQYGGIQISNRIPKMPFMRMLMGEQKKFHYELVLLRLATV